MEPKRASPNISLRSKNSNGRQFLFEDFAETKPVAKEDAYKNTLSKSKLKHTLTTKKLTKGIFLFHRGIKSSLRFNDTRDKAWEGTLRRKTTFLWGMNEQKNYLF